MEREPMTIMSADDVTWQPGPGCCYHCGVPVRWDESVKIVDETGSFVDDDGEVECFTGRWHQG